ncbi:MAG: DegT/DnrJ/EryC1/StrS family aminotransferase [Acidobacteria bacterium]|nr:DegT/DnrJ/EryC1/StrS family aminotransferase [Acidobacteriota bacterium]
MSQSRPKSSRESDDPSGRWEWSAEEIRRIGYRVVDLIATHLTSLPDRPVFRPFPAQLASKYLSSTPPELGQDADDILETFAQEIEPYPFGNGHPRFYGWVNSPPVVMGIFGEALAAAMNPSCAGGNHAPVYVEREVINWFRQILGFPPGCMGLLVSGGSMAALTALAAARHHHCGDDIRTRGLQAEAARLTFYRTAEAHSCHQKAIELLGVGSENLRRVAHDSCLRMSPEALDSAIRADRARGSKPIAVIASAGTVNTGAIDPLDKLAEVCARHQLWLHVDAAYGGPAILSETYGKELSAISRADSIALDPHKWFYVPVEAGLVLVRNGATLRAAFSLVPPYLQTDGKTEGVAGLPWFSEYGFQQTRAFRALKIWMALHYHGLSGYRRSIERDIALAERLTRALKTSGRFEVFEPQQLSIVCFRYAPSELAQRGGDLDALNRALLERVQLEGKAFLSSTVIADKFWLRACIVNPRARDQDIDMVPELILETAQSLIP